MSQLSDVQSVAMPANDEFRPAGEPLPSEDHAFTATVTGQQNAVATDPALTCAEQNRKFLEAVLVWPGPNEAPGWINAHANVRDKDPKKNGGKPYVVGWPFKNLNDFINRALWIDNSGTFFNAWMCMSQQRECTERNGRKKAVRLAKNATWLKAIWVDIDIKPKPAAHAPGEPWAHYETFPEAWDVMQALCSKTALPLPSAVVNSGGGLHIYWTSDKPLSPEEWRPYAEGLKALLLREGVKCDVALTTDIARLLRVPGTLNHKYSPARRVELVHLGQPYNFATELSVLCRVAPAKSLAAARSAPALYLIEPGHEDEFADGPDPAFAELTCSTDTLGARISRRRSEPLDPGPVFEKCGFMRHARDTGGADYDNPLWHLSVLCTAFMDNGSAIAHEISKGHPTYTEAETQAMYERKLADRAERGIGWPSCTTIHGAGCKSCASCPFLANGKSPLHLAGPVTATVSPGARLGDASEGNEWFPKLLAAKQKEVIKFAVRHIANNSPLFDRTEHGGSDRSIYQLAIAIARSGVDEAENIFVEAASSARNADVDQRQFYQSCIAGSAEQDGLTAGTLIDTARALGANFGSWEHVAATSTLTAIYAPGNEQNCRELLDHVVAADGRTFTLGDPSGPLVILRKPEEDTLPSDTKWQGDLPATTLAKSADIMMRAERLTWLQRAGGKSDERFVRTGPPRAFVNDYLDQMRGQYSASPLVAVVRIPRIDDAGAIHFTPGYDGKTGLFHDRVPGFYVPLACSLAIAREAANALLLPFSKYKFEDSQAGSALLLAAIFTALERPFIPVAPMFVIRSSMPGTGKGLIVNTLTCLAFDTKPVVVTWGGNNEEFEKRLAALLLQAPAALSVDNANGMQITGDLLESIITEGSADIRPLGRSETVRVRNRSLLMLTGNNPVITGDMARRALSVSILPQSSNPERDRYAFNPVTVVNQRRPEFLQAAFTAMRAFRLAGMPEHGLPAAGSFEEWSRRVRDLVYWITDYDVAEAFRQNKAEDPRRQNDAALLAALHQCFGSVPFRAADVIKVYKQAGAFEAAPPTTAEQAVCEALEDVLGAKNVTAKILGYWARRMKGARSGGFTLDTQQNTTTHTNDLIVRPI
jgi:hypothetical protein